MKQEYAVVRMNSTSGPYIVERSTENIRRSSQAHIAYSGEEKKAVRVCTALNNEVCPMCGGTLESHSETWKDCKKVKGRVL